MVRELGSILPVGRGPLAAQALARVSDLIVTWAVTNVDGLLAGIDHPPKVIMACHFPGESPWGPGTEDLLRSVAKFVAVSELAVESTPFSVRDRVEVIWNAVDPDRLIGKRERSTVRDDWDVPRNAPVIGFIGRLAPEKDPDAMLRLATELPEPWHVVIVGDGRESEALSRKIEAESLNHVHLVGGDPSVGDALNGLDWLVVPSRYESFGLTLAEGLWAGVPVIATNSGLARLVPGLVREIPVGASGRELIEALMADVTDREGTLGRLDRAQRFVREHLTLERFGREWTGLLVDLARPRKGCLS
jgi:glycosyltransferase involved in cell wall biosynthesis